MSKKYNLVGIDGNAFAVMGYVKQSMKKEGKTQVEIDAYSTDAKSGGYDHLLGVSQDMIDALNEGRED